MATALDKSRRQELLQRLLTEHDLHSQEEVRDALADAGVDTTQATVSRDLDELGAVKIRSANGNLVYRLSPAPGPGSARARLDRTLQQFVTGIDPSGNLVVLRTPPACAHPVASAIDLAELPDVLATVAGDDTVLVVTTQDSSGDAVAADLQQRIDPSLEPKEMP